MKKILAMVLGLSLSFSALARDFEETKKSAESGDSLAQCNLGMIYYKQQDYVNALKWFTKASENGNKISQNNLAIMYRDGLGTPKDSSKAIELLEKLANQGMAVSEFNLASAYYKNGNKNLAFDWYLKASQQNLPEAQSNLAKMYLIAEGTKQNYEQAFYWYQLLAQKEDIDAQNSLGGFYKEGIVVPQNYKQAVYWFNKSAIQGNLLAQYNLGIMYDFGLSVPKNKIFAKKWYMKACISGLQQGCQAYKNLQ